MLRKSEKKRSRKTYANPHHANAPNPIAIIIHEIVPNGRIIYAANIKNTVCIRKPKKMKTNSDEAHTEREKDRTDQI